MSFTLDHFRFRQAKILALLAHIENSQVDRIKGGPAARIGADVYRRCAIPTAIVAGILLSIGFGAIIGICMSAISIAFALEVRQIQSEVAQRVKPHLTRLSAMNLVLALNITAALEGDHRTRRVATKIIANHPTDKPLDEEYIRTVLLAATATCRFDALLIGAYLEMMLRSEIDRRLLSTTRTGFLARLAK